MRENKSRKPGRYKMTAAEQKILSDKVAEIAKLLAMGKSQKQIRVELSEKYNCTEQVIHIQIKQAIKAMQSSIEKRLDYVVALQRERLENILYGAVEKKDFATAQKIIDTMNRLYGIYEHKANIKVDAPNIKFSFGNITNNEEEKEDE